MDIAKKELGQHWLNDQTSLESIVRLADLNLKDIVLEIGPGQGSLTSLLAQSAARVVAVEIDDLLIAGLRSRFANQPKVEIVSQDIRNYNLSLLPTNYKCVANVPYYLTSYLIRLLSQATNRASVLVLLVQREVAERIAAKPGKMSILAVMAQAYWLVELGPIVRAELFIPPPKVDSRIIKMVRRDVFLIPQDLEKEFMQLVKIGFSQKRKTLLNSLSAGLKIDKLTIQTILAKVGLGSTIRAQSLSLDEWNKLTIEIFKKQTNR